MTIKFYFYSKGDCKNKTQCSQSLTTRDCVGQCEDENNCLNRHRAHCKNGSSCVCLLSNNCEFLPTENYQR